MFLRPDVLKAMSAGPTKSPNKTTTETLQHTSSPMTDERAAEYDKKKR
jgi:hypothetical protein